MKNAMEEKNLSEVKEVTILLTDNDKQFVSAFADVKDAICEYRPAVGEKPVVCRVIFYEMEE